MKSLAVLAFVHTLLLSVSLHSCCVIDEVSLSAERMLVLNELAPPSRQNVGFRVECREWPALTVLSSCGLGGREAAVFS